MFSSTFDSSMDTFISNSCQISMTPVSFVTISYREDTSLRKIPNRNTTFPLIGLCCKHAMQTLYSITGHQTEAMRGSQRKTEDGEGQQGTTLNTGKRGYCCLAQI